MENNSEFEQSYESDDSQYNFIPEYEIKVKGTTINEEQVACREENLIRMHLDHNTNQHKLIVLVRKWSRTINTTKKPILQKKQSI